MGVGLCLFAACGDAGSGAANDGSGEPNSKADERNASPKETIEMFSWWVSGGERDALWAVLDVHKEHFPNTAIVNVAEQQAETAHETLSMRMAEGDPPDTFQTNIGADLLSWIDAEETDSALQPLDEQAESEGWLDIFPAELVAAASRDGKLYGVPLNVHRTNSLFYNKRLFDSFDLKPPTTLEEFNALVVTIAESEEIQASNPGGVAPLALGNKWNWTLNLMTFESVLSAVAGADYYERFWTGHADAADEELQRTLDEVLFLYCGPAPELECNGYFNSDIDDVDWAKGVQKIVTGDAAMAVMGDWAKGYLEEESHVADEDFGVVPFPGSNGTYVFTADTFPIPRGANNEATRALLATFGSVPGQVAFNSLKGSIPARADIDPADYPDAFDAMDARTMREFREGRRVLALSGLVPSGVLGDLAPKLKESMQAKTTAIVQQYLSENYASLK